MATPKATAAADIAWSAHVRARDMFVLPCGSGRVVPVGIGSGIARLDDGAAGLDPALDAAVEVGDVGVAEVS